MPFAPIVPFNWQRDPYVWLDFSASNADLETLDLTDTAHFSDYVFRTIAEAGAVVGVGGYDEHRVIYRRSAHFSQTEEPRCIHLGADVWAAAGTSVAAPVAGRVHSFANNAHFGDYGPTIILEHNPTDETPEKVFTLYGHLSEASLTGLYEGKLIQKGEPFATFGDYPTNGDWPPHLHFQVMTELLGRRGDFPGVCSLSDRAYFLKICLNPYPWLGID